MPWKNYLQLKEEYSDSEFQKNFIELFTIKVFLEYCLIPSGYSPNSLIERAIFLSSEGEKWVPLIQQSIKNISQEEIKYALFAKFFHHDLFIDVYNSDNMILQKFLDAEIKGERIKFPWVFGRILYDRFFEIFPIQTKELSYDETDYLLKKTPKGVFQIRDVLIGPFGVLNSGQFRFLPPTRTVPLWHCSDPSCKAFHSVRLSSGKSKIIEAIDFIEEKSKKTKGPPSEWDFFFFRVAKKSDYYNEMHPGQLPWRIVNAFSETEIRNIIKRIIEHHSNEIRSRFPKAKRFKNILSGSAEKISKRLNKTQCFQLILLMSDEIITSNLEFLIDNKIIHIPSTEIRTTKKTYPSNSWLQVDWECSQFGVRPISSENIAFARLKLLINELYKKQLKQLKWKLRHIDGESVYEKLDNYLYSEDPENVICELVIATPDNIQQAFKLLRYGRFVFPSTPQDERRLIQKILWKLGFDIRIYPSHQKLFWARLENFIETLKASTIYDEQIKESIRSACVNFFVSLEEILDYSLSFITWALLSDHYGITKFICNFEEARRFMASNLKGRRLGSNEPLKLDPEGKNTLYPLIQGFVILAELCNEIIQNREIELRRPENERPGYYGNTEIELFPFFHKALILDLKKGEQDRIIELLKEITDTLEKSKICDIRNRLEHKRKDFPDQNEIVLACDAIKNIINKLENTGICPLIYLYNSVKIDQYRRGIVMLKNYRGRENQIRIPSQYNRCGLPLANVPLIIVPWIHIGDSVEFLRFQFKENSDFEEMWQDYPKRKLRLPDEQQRQKFESEQE